MHAVTLLWAVDQAQASDIPGKYSTRKLHLSTTIFSLKKKKKSILLNMLGGGAYHGTQQSGQFSLPICGSWSTNSGWQGWWQALLP